MKKRILFFLLLTYQATGIAQQINPSQEKILKQKEDSMKVPAMNLVYGNTANNRFDADSLFTKMLVRALKTPNSFYYPFDSLLTISKIYAPDQSFRIFTWQLAVDENLVRQHGAIQVKTADGSLKLFPLLDKSDFISNVLDTITDNRAWVGAIYYKMIQTQYNNQNYYTLLGFDENNIRSNKKLIEVLHFDNGIPTFGGGFFSFEKDTVAKKTISRYIMEYKKDAGPRLTYDNDMQMIVFEHLESESNEPKKKWTLVPDGDYEGFSWQNGKWVHIEKIFTQITPEGQEPVPAPVKDAEGNTMEDKLKDNVIPQSSDSTATKPAPVLKTKPKKTKNQ